MEAMEIGLKVLMSRLCDPMGRLQLLNHLPERRSAAQREEEEEEETLASF